MREKTNLSFYKLIQAFRQLYEQVGLGWVYAITKYEPVSVLSFLIVFVLPISIFKSKKSCLCFFFKLGIDIKKKCTSCSKIGKLADAVYSIWAKYRLPITGKSNFMKNCFFFFLTEF